MQIGKEVSPPLLGHMHGTGQMKVSEILFQKTSLITNSSSAKPGPVTYRALISHQKSTGTRDFSELALVPLIRDRKVKGCSSLISSEIQSRPVSPGLH